jgi:GTPase SAR1 family protein
VAYREEIVKEVKIANQFFHLGQVVRPELFFDRKDEMESAYITCEQILNGGVGGILVLGGKGVGKTSFLDALIRKLTENKISCAKITLTENMVKPESELLFIDLILTELLKAAKNSGLLENDLVDKVTYMLKGLKIDGQIDISLPGLNFIAHASKENIKSFPSIALRDGLADYIKLIETKGKKDTRKGAVLFFDEGTCLTLNKNLMQIFKSVFQNTPGIAVVIAGTSQLLDDVSNVFSPLPRGFLKIDLGPYPDDRTALEAIQKPIEISQKIILEKYNHTYELNVFHVYFDRHVIMTTGRMPLEINMLCRFAFDIAAQNCKLDGKTINLYLNFDKELLDVAFKQFVGTKGYSDFLSVLDDNATSFLKILSKSAEKASLDEMSVLLRLDLCKGSLQDLPISNVKTIIDECSDDSSNMLKIVKCLNEKAKKNKVNVFGSNVLGQLYDVDDQFIRAYFKYGWVDQYEDVELVGKSKFDGLRVFGDPVSSILHSVFFPRVSEFTGKDVAQRVHTGQDNGLWLRPQRECKLLVVAYLRLANNSLGHYAVNLEKSYETGQLETDFKSILDSLSAKRLLKDYAITIIPA